MVEWNVMGTSAVDEIESFHDFQLISMLFLASNSVGIGPERSIDAFCFGYNMFQLRRSHHDHKSVHFHYKFNIPEN